VIKLINILKEIANIYKDDSDTWTHTTNRDEVIKNFKFYKYNDISKKYVEFDIEKFNP